ncbi:4Fe-4S ferredoxin-type, iron-sulphur binding domain [Syntrophomonas zehnderi OL-4]|uniref:4Fe-4S ferredoxin-type, iron-sulphur binding domain n=1 Tax=Syntrophomonas zehnderi OL-4 TaxID=690567 RepID=A0A0E4C8N9_9FIRM|nr:4Fe-4S dicluster domain-containing protein [Syntrophomonas zehnderi]CFX56351.1 4Fe-4S ferredoxin-type, iron-sulphur binding domain [Syntrophomonas zehnderi OL-4]
MKVVAWTEYCLGCGLCEIYCAAQHDGYNGNVLKIFKKGRPMHRSRLLKAEQGTWLNTCMHCTHAPCINGCISGAIKRDPNGIVYVDYERCVGCYSCVMLCPHGHVRPWSERHQVLKCDLCRDTGLPSCVANCPNGALQLVD